MALGMHGVKCDERDVIAAPSKDRWKGKVRKGKWVGGSSSQARGEWR